MKIKRYALLSSVLLLLANGMFQYQPSFRVSAGSTPGQRLPGARATAASTLITPQGSRLVYPASLAISVVTESVEKNLLVLEGFAFILGGFLLRKRLRTKPATSEV